MAIVKQPHTSHFGWIVIKFVVKFVSACLDIDGLKSAGPLAL